MLQVVIGARNRGRMLVSGGISMGGGESDAEFVRRILTNLGFGPTINIWVGGPEYLPADWPEEGKEDLATWPARQVWFEADWFGTSDPPPVEDPDFWENLAKLNKAWRFIDVAPYCWASPTMTRPAGYAYCEGVTPPGPEPPGPQPPGPGPEPPGPQPPGPEPPGPQPPGPEPTNGKSSSSWLFPVLGILAGATMIGGVVYVYRSRG